MWPLIIIMNNNKQWNISIWSEWKCCTLNRMGMVQLPICMLIIVFSRGLLHHLSRLVCRHKALNVHINILVHAHIIVYSVSVLVSAHVCMWVSEQNVGQTSFRYSVSCANTACGWAESAWHLQKLTHTHKAHTHTHAGAFEEEERERCSLYCT